MKILWFVLLLVILAGCAVGPPLTQEERQTRALESMARAQRIQAGQAIANNLQQAFRPLIPPPPRMPVFCSEIGIYTVCN